MNSVISTRTQLPHQLPSLHYIPKSKTAEDLSIASDKLKDRGVDIHPKKYSPKSETMFNRGNKPGVGDKGSSGFVLFGL